MSFKPNPDYMLEPEHLVEMIPALRAFSRTFYNQREDAEDLVQETLMKALANREKYIPYSPLKSWLLPSCATRSARVFAFKSARRRA